MSPDEIIEQLKLLTPEGRRQVFRWLKSDNLQDLWRRADELMKDAPKYTEEEILNFPRVRPPGF